MGEIFEKRQVIAGLETTGVGDGHRIIEIGCIELIRRQPSGRHFHRYINPNREIDAEALEVHGITNAFLTDKPGFTEIAYGLVEFLNGAELIVHNAPFTCEFINYELNLMVMPPLEKICIDVVDTLKMAKEMRPRKSNSLNDLIAEYGVDPSGSELHGTLLDANLLAEIYLAMTYRYH